MDKRLSFFSFVFYPQEKKGTADGNFLNIKNFLPKIF